MTMTPANQPSRDLRLATHTRTTGALWHAATVLIALALGFGLFVARTEGNSKIDRLGVLAASAVCFVIAGGFAYTLVRRFRACLRVEPTGLVVVNTWRTRRVAPTEMREVVIGLADSLWSTNSRLLLQARIKCTTGRNVDIHGLTFDPRLVASVQEIAPMLEQLGHVLSSWGVSSDLGSKLIGGEVIRAANAESMQRES